jgi:hypothetical protein
MATQQPPHHQEFDRELKEQDRVLVQMSGYLGQLIVTSQSIGTEIAHQDRLLKDVETRVDSAQHKVDDANSKISQFTKRVKQNSGLIITGVLLLIACVLAIVAFT